jgi:hypothetical protein
MRTPYSFCILRYVHDMAGEEFVNIGVVVLAPEVGFLGARCTQHYRRAARLFGHIDGAAFRRLAEFVERETNKLGRSLKDRLPLLDKGIENVMAKILPPDASAIRFSEAGAGLTKDPARTLAELYERFVGRYERGEREKRTEEDVWRTFQKPLARQDVVQYLTPRKVVAPNYEYEFKHAWKNGAWHALEPVSFDLVDEQNVLEKASRWLGRMSSLKDATEPVVLHVLMGAPSDEDLQGAFERAQNLLREMPGKHELHREADAEQVAKWLAAEIKAHEHQDR